MMIDLAQSHDEPYTKLGAFLKKYRAAMVKLENLPSDAVFSIRAIKKPPSAVKSALKALAMLLGERPPAKESESNPLEWWKVIHIKILSDKGVVRRLAHFEKDNLPPEVLDEAAGCVEWIDAHEDLSVEIGDVSAAVTALYNWVAAVVDYGKLVAVIQPQLDSLKAAAAELAVLNTASQKLKERREAKAASELVIEATMTGRNRKSVRVEAARRQRDRE
eukprot:SAG22_NODE_8441_length_656_cov_1.055655_1_plen_218_part_11